MKDIRITIQTEHAKRPVQLPDLPVKMAHVMTRQD